MDLFKGRSDLLDRKNYPKLYFLAEVLAGISLDTIGFSLEEIYIYLLELPELLSQLTNPDYLNENEELIQTFSRTVNKMQSQKKSLASSLVSSSDQSLSFFESIPSKEEDIRSLRKKRQNKGIKSKSDAFNFNLFISGLIFNRKMQVSVIEMRPFALFFERLCTRLFIIYFEGNSTLDQIESIVNPIIESWTVGAKSVEFVRNIRKLIDRMRKKAPSDYIKAIKNLNSGNLYPGELGWEEISILLEGYYLSVFHASDEEVCKIKCIDSDDIDILEWSTINVDALFLIDDYIEFKIPGAENIGPVEEVYDAEFKLFKDIMVAISKSRYRVSETLDQVELGYKMISEYIVKIFPRIEYILHLNMEVESYKELLDSFKEIRQVYGYFRDLIRKSNEVSESILDYYPGHPLAVMFKVYFHNLRNSITKERATKEEFFKEYNKFIEAYPSYRDYADLNLIVDSVSNYSKQKMNITPVETLPTVVTYTLQGLEREVTEEELKVLLINLVTKSNLAEREKILEKINRPKVWNHLIMPVFRNLNSDTNDFQKTRAFAKEVGDRVTVSEFRGGDKITISINIDEGTKVLCRIIIGGEIDEEGILIRQDVLSPKPKAIVDEKLLPIEKISIKPDSHLQNIFNIVTDNLKFLPGIDLMDLENGDLTLGLSKYLVFLLQNTNLWLDNENTRNLIIGIFKICAGDSEIQEQMKYHLADMIRNGMLNNILVLRANGMHNVPLPRVVAKHLLFYIARELETNSKQYNVFTREAQIFFDNNKDIGNIRYDMSNKQWLGRTEYRMNSCIVDLSDDKSQFVSVITIDHK